MSDERARIFTFLCYPDEFNGNYLSILRDSFLPVLVSPIHNPENNDEWDPESNGEGKRHCHVMIQFDGKKNLDQVNAYVQAFRDLGLPCTRAWVVLSKLGLAAYFVHDGWPDKEQFSYNQLICLNGFKYSNELLVPVSKVIEYIDDMGLYEWCDLLDSLKINHPEWLDSVVSGRSHAIIKYLDSKRFKDEAKIKKMSMAYMAGVLDTQSLSYD